MGESAFDGKGDRIRGCDREVMHTASRCAADELVTGLEQRDRARACGDPGNRSARGSDLGARQSEIALEDRRDALGVVDHHRNAGEGRRARIGP